MQQAFGVFVIYYAMKFKLLIIISVNLLIPRYIYSQKQANNWCFGDSAGISFASNLPQALYNSAISATGATVSLSNPLSGELLLYSNGKTVWNSDHEIMVNGNGLFSSAQGQEINNATSNTYSAPIPANSNQYFLFTFLTEKNQTSYQYKSALYYSIIDMSLDHGKGGIITDSKNILIRDSLAEKISVIPHSNGRDFWLLLQGINSNKFFSYLITAEGITLINVQTLGSGTSSEFGESLGFIKASPDSRKVAVTSLSFGSSTETRPLELYDFDNTTGILSGLETLGNYSAMYGVSFSPSSQLLYVQGISSEGPDAGDFIYQLDLNNSNPILSRTGLIRNDPKFANLTNAFGIFQLELAPDGKVYGSGAIDFDGGLANNLLVINNPNLSGKACSVSFLNLNYPDQRVNNSLPTFIQSIFRDITPTDNPNSPCNSEVVNLSPNPAQDFIQIKVSERCFVPYTLNIYNSLGQMIRQMTIGEQDSGKLVINELASGLYFMVLKFQNKRILKRFMKY